MIGTRPWIGVCAGLLAAAWTPAVLAQGNSPRFAGRPLADALRILQRDGLRIVFSTAIVTPDMTVADEPHGRTTRAILAELLAPHGLETRPGPAGIVEIVRARRATPAAPAAPRAPPARASPPIPSFAERLTVQGRVDEVRRHPEGGPETTIEGTPLRNARPVLVDDPVRAAHVLPRVVATDDARSEFSVRAGDPRHVGILVDGVPAPWLIHTAYGRGEVGSVSMIAGDLVDRVTLATGARPVRQGDGLAASLSLHVREGERGDARLRAAVSGIGASLTGEGPLGGRAHETGPVRGSWIVSLRQGFNEWPVLPRGAPSRTVFGITDALAKTVFDVSGRHQASATVLAGHTGVDERDELAPSMLGDGLTRAALAIAGWRSTFDSGARLAHRAYVASYAFSNRTQAGDSAGGNGGGEAGFQTELSMPFAGGRFEAGADVRRTHGARSSDPLPTSWTYGGYVAHTRVAGTKMLVTPGVRLEHDTFAGQTVASPWLLGELMLNDRWRVTTGASMAHQFPAREILWRSAAPRADRAVNFDAGIERRLRDDLRVQATAFVRRERLVDGPTQASRGIEIVIARETDAGLSGWAAYAYGRSRATDGETGETFRGDFDRRHSITIAASFHSSPRTSLTATFIGASNVPLPGRLTGRQGHLAAGSTRNAVWLPAYSRLDLRASRTLKVGWVSATLFGEVMNALDRANQAPAAGSIDLLTGEATGFTRALLPRRFSAGVIIDF